MTAMSALDSWTQGSHTADGITHRSYVTQAWTENPIKELLVKMAAAQSLTRIAGGPSSAGR